MQKLNPFENFHLNYANYLESVPEEYELFLNCKNSGNISGTWFENHEKIYTKSGFYIVITGGSLPFFNYKK